MFGINKVSASAELNVKRARDGKDEMLEFEPLFKKRKQNGILIARITLTLMKQIFHSKAKNK